MYSEYLFYLPLYWNIVLTLKSYFHFENCISVCAFPFFKRVWKLTKFLVFLT